MAEEIHTFKCNLCGSSEYTVRFSIRGKHLIRCNECGLVCRHPMPNHAELDSIYSGRDYFATGYFAVDDEKRKTSHYKQFVRISKIAGRHCSRGGKLLDIGPGKGTFLKLCIDNGVACEGLEISTDMAEKLRAGLKCVINTGALEELDCDGVKYSVITAFDLIEHLADPAKWLAKANKLLEINGLLVISTMNINNLLDTIGTIFYKLGISKPVEKLYPDFHLYYFTDRTLSKYIEKAGFVCESLAQENYDPAKASGNIIEKLFLKIVYQWHNLTGNKTNQYLIAKKIKEL